MDSVLDKTGLSYFWGKIKAWVTSQGYTTNTGTITSVKMNGSTVASSGEADLGTVITSETALSKGTTTGSGNAVTDLSVSGHQITLTKGKTFLESYTETDPVFTASAAYGISSSDITNWNNKEVAVFTINYNGSTFDFTSSMYSEISTALSNGKIVFIRYIQTNSNNKLIVFWCFQTWPNVANTIYAYHLHGSNTNSTVSIYRMTLLSDGTMSVQTDTGNLVSSSDITNWNGKADQISIVSHGTSDTTFTLTPNVFHTWGTVTSLTLTLGTGTSYLDEYMFEFTSGSTATTLSLPNAVSWINGTPTIATNTTYQVSIVNNLAVIGGTV